MMLTVKEKYYFTIKGDGTSDYKTVIEETHSKKKRNPYDYHQDWPTNLK